MGPFTPFLIGLGYSIAGGAGALGVGSFLTALPGLISATAAFAAPSLLASANAPSGGGARSPALQQTAAAPAQAAQAPTPSAVNREASEAAEREALRRRVSAGQSTILTGPLGRVSEGAVGQTILGGY